MPSTVVPCRWLLFTIAVSWTRAKTALAQTEQAAPLDVHFEQLGKLLAIKLQTEDSRPAVKLQTFDNFQDLIEYDCQGRLALLMNRTIQLRDDLRTYHQTVADLGGLYVELLSKIPEENSWIWLIVTTRERIMQLVHHYFSEIVSIALDRQECLLTDVRRQLMDTSIAWKQLHADRVFLQWNAFAFGSYGDSAVTEAKQAGLPAVPWASALIACDRWLVDVVNWFETHAQKLFKALQEEFPKSALLNGDTVAARMHHQDEQGMFVPYEYLRRKAFGQWALDKGLLRGLLRFVWKPLLGDSERISVADFGAGGGQYSTWLNETGLVSSFAFDGTPQVGVITNGTVNEVNLITDLTLWRKFDWIICLEVGEHIPKQHATTLLHNLKRHATKGLIMSWSDDWEGIGHVNCLSKSAFVELVERETGFHHDAEITEVVKNHCEIDYIARTLSIFRAEGAV